ncbi:MAG: hypothetical protein RBU30_06180 [Polyangia bacterium]|jgi:tetratricopeptide (TPR) repeat protein|nr:hypothetical protein [Polyangia bacterium]
MLSIGAWVLCAALLSPLTGQDGAGGKPATGAEAARPGGTAEEDTAQSLGEIPPAPRSHQELDALLEKLGSKGARTRRVAVESIRRAEPGQKALYLARLGKHSFQKYAETQRLLLAAAGVVLPGPSGWFEIPKLKPGEKDPADQDVLEALLAHPAPADGARREAYARALETMAVLRGLSGMGELDLAEPLLQFAFEPYGVTFRWEVVRAIRSLGGYAVPALLKASRIQVYDWKKERAKFLLQRFANHLLSTMEQANPTQALAMADKKLQLILLKAYGLARHADAVEAILGLTDHEDRELREAARDSIGQFFKGKPPKAHVKRLKLPGGTESEHHQKLYLTYRERAVFEVRSALERLTEGRYDRGIPGAELLRMLFAKQDELRRTRWSRKLAEAIALGREGDREGALRLGEEVLRHEPQLQDREALFPLYAERAEALAKRGRLLEAASVMERSALLLPGAGGPPSLEKQRRATLADAAYLRALSLEGAGKQRGAIAMHRQALSIWPEHMGSKVALLHLDPEPRLDPGLLWALVLLAGLGAPGLLVFVQLLRRLRTEGEAEER